LNLRVRIEQPNQIGGVAIRKHIRIIVFGAPLLNEAYRLAQHFLRRGVQIVRFSKMKALSAYLERRSINAFVIMEGCGEAERICRADLASEDELLGTTISAPEQLERAINDLVDERPRRPAHREAA